MGIYLQVVQIPGMEWKKKKSLKREDAYKLIMLLLKPIGK